MHRSQITFWSYCVRAYWIHTLDFHKEKHAVLTVAAIRVPIEKASAFGVIEVDAEGR